MGVTHQYLRYSSGPVFGILASADAQIAYLNYQNVASRYYVVTACENVLLWDTRTKQSVTTYRGEKHSATCLATSPDHRQLAVGYADGAVRVFDVNEGDAVITFQGHKAPVTSLDFDKGRLASGGKDSVIILWDVVSEAGMFRLKGHKGVVTRCRFMKDRNILVSSSKDTFVKFWDLATQHCFKTLVGHRSEVWDFVLVKRDSWLVSGSADSELRVWQIADKDTSAQTVADAEAKKSKVGPEEADGKNSDDDDEDDDESFPLTCTKFGNIMREGRGRICSLVVDPAEKAILCHGTDSLVEVFKLNTEDEVKKKLQKRERKERKKRLKTTAEDEPEEEVRAVATIGDTVERLQSFKCGGKPCAIDIRSANNGLAKVAVALKNNQVEFHALNVTDKACVPALVDSIQHAGHRTDVRTLCFSSDNTAILSASGETVKVWSRTSQQCLRSMECEYALCSTFLPGDRHCVVGTKTGKLQLFDIGAKALVSDVAAHDGATWSLDTYPDKKGLVSGSGDKTVKFWDLDLAEKEGAKVLTLVHTRTLQMSEDVLCVRLTPNGKLLAVSLMDSTVKVFFVDTLKFFLSMYGHKFPVLCMDVSYDSMLLATGSADRSVKIWGLDFGDCHRSILAHEDSIMCLQFLPKTHMFFTGSKDASIKQWDADNFQKVVTLEGHQGEVWALGVSPNGKFVATSSHDRSLRLWLKTDEPLVLEEEREMEREAEFEASSNLEEAVIPREGGKDEVGLAAKKTVETVKIAERLLEAIDVYKEEKAKLEEYAGLLKTDSKDAPQRPAPHPLLTVYQTTCPERYMLETLRRIRYSELEETLLVLPFGYVIELLKALSELLSRNWEVELCCRCLFFLLRVHSGQIGATSALVPVVDRLRLATLDRLGKARDAVGFNLAGLRFLQRELDSREEVALFTDATRAFKERKKKKARKEKAILSLVAS